eukprot:Clim_evm7s20 gene=Clim_evmTU7s20
MADNDDLVISSEENGVQNMELVQAPLKLSEDEDEGGDDFAGLSLARTKAIMHRPKRRPSQAVKTLRFVGAAEASGGTDDRAFPMISGADDDEYDPTTDAPDSEDSDYVADEDSGADDHGPPNAAATVHIQEELSGIHNEKEAQERVGKRKARGKAKARKPNAKRPKTAVNEARGTDIETEGTGGTEVGLAKEVDEAEQAGAWNTDDYALFDEHTDLFQGRDFGGIDLKPDHRDRPVWITPEGRIFLETFSPVYEQAYDFLIAIAEPVCRPQFIHEYQITSYSLYAAASVGLQTNHIVEVLERLCKSAIPENLARYIRFCTESYGRLSLVLRGNNYYIESPYLHMLQRLLEIPDIQSAIVRQSTPTKDGSVDRGDIIFRRRRGAADLEASRVAIAGFRTAEDKEKEKRAAEIAKELQASRELAEEMGDEFFNETETPEGETNLASGSRSATMKTKSTGSTSQHHEDGVALAGRGLVGENVVLDDAERERRERRRRLEKLEEIEVRSRATQRQKAPVSPNAAEGNNVEDTEVADEVIAIGSDTGGEEPVRVAEDIYEAIDRYAEHLDQEDEDLEEGDNPEGVGKAWHAFQIAQEHVEKVKSLASGMHMPLLEEYDFREDKRNPVLYVDIKPTTKLRDYQEKSLSKMFGRGRARSGVVCLPCGAGKTLAGVSAICTIKKRTVVLCTSVVAVEQWRSQLKMWTTANDNMITRFTAQHKDPPVENGVFITTYSMMAHQGRRTKEAQKVLDFVTGLEWGMIILDEVHVVPASMFRRVLTVVQAHHKLGLTATLVREDDKIMDLKYLIGPKLYEANWIDLQKKRYIANVSCAEVWCPMTPEFFREYLALEYSQLKQKLLWIMNPNKFHAVQALITYHEMRGDKIIVFSDNIFGLERYARKLDKPYIYGKTSNGERLNLLQQFQHNPKLNCIFMSKIGDNSFDLPDANVLIQISSHYGSRRQEAQRLGRILRPKRGSNPDEFNAFFYSVVSENTAEMYYSSKRQQYLMDQGYSFKVLTFEDLMEITRGRFEPSYKSREAQLDLLLQVRAAGEEAALDEFLRDEDESAEARERRTKRRMATMSAISGADDMVYLEMERERPVYGESRQQQRRRQARNQND